jgi:hypothetical protein
MLMIDLTDGSGLEIDTGLTPQHFAEGRPARHKYLRLSGRFEIFRKSCLPHSFASARFSPYLGCRLQEDKIGARIGGRVASFREA